MLVRIILYILGIFLITCSFSFYILYINLFSFGYTFKEYLSYILSQKESYYIIIGFIFINISIFLKGEKNGKHL